MTFKADERISETTNTTGLGTYTLLGAATGYQSFTVLGANNTCPYFATNIPNGSEWEVGIGTVLIGPNRLERTQVLRSSAGTSAIDWPSGTKTVRCGPIGALSLPRALSKSVAGGAGTTVLTQNEQRSHYIEFTGALTGNRIIEVDSTPWTWVVTNNTTGAFSLSFRITGGASINIPQSVTLTLACRGGDVYRASFDYLGDPNADRIPFWDESINAYAYAQVTGGLIVSGNDLIVADGGITTVKIADQNVSTAKIADNAVNSSKIADANVTTAKLQDDAVTQAKLANAAVGDAELKYTSGDVTTTDTTTGANLTLAGGGRGFYPQIQQDSAGSGMSARIGANFNATNLTTNIHLLSIIGNSVRARQYYIQASPPYDHGDGEVPLYVFALVDSLGNIVATYSAEDPPWANNGPTNIRVDFFDGQGRGWQRRRPRPNLAALQDPAQREAELARLAGPPELIHVSQVVKHADMSLIPHPFTDNDLTGMTVVLLDPVGQVTERLHRIHRSGEPVPTVR